MLYYSNAFFVPLPMTAKALGELLADTLEEDTKVYIFRAFNGSPYLTEELENKIANFIDYCNNVRIQEKLN